MKVYTKNNERPIVEMDEMWDWMTDHFGVPEAHNSNNRRWTYGKDTGRGLLGSDTIINGTWEIEWFDFRDEKDVTMFVLRWS